MDKLSSEEKLRCEVCGRAITKEESEKYDGMCWECWDDQLTEESDSMFDDLTRITIPICKGAAK